MMQSALQISFAQQSSAGRKPENQDTVGARLPEESTLATKGIAIAIADGVSSSKAAREASQTAITGFLTDYYATPDTWSIQQSADRVIQSLNHSLWGRSQNSIYGEGYLSTFSTLILRGASGFIFHVGDTRVYRLRGDLFECLTRDHVQKINRHKTYLSRALGADSSLEVDMHTFELERDDLFVLTSDGVHEAIPTAELLALVRAHRNDPEALTRAALDCALRHGSDDNLSIQVALIKELGSASQTDVLRGMTSLPFPPLLSPGCVIDGLTIKKILHESSRSQVYLVHDKQQRSLVMKTPSAIFQDDPLYIERFALEPWIGARIQSPYIARVVPPPDGRSCLYYLTEYIPGPTLAQLLKERGQLAIADAVELIDALIRGIRAFHRKETLHQDLKPDNIVIGRSGPVIVDFGSCWVASLQQACTATVHENVLGTLDYSAPEYRYGGTIGPRADQFSLAVLMYEMLTGKLPYGDSYSGAMEVKHFQKLPYISATHYNPLVPHWMDLTLKKALSIYPDDRYPALSEWLQDLKRPNPAWLSMTQRPLIHQHPEAVWKIVGLAGWGVSLVMCFLLWF